MSHEICDFIFTLDSLPLGGQIAWRWQNKWNAPCYNLFWCM